MENLIQIDGYTYSRSLFDQEDERLLAMYLETSEKLNELKNIRDALRVAEGEFVEEICSEFVEMSSGISLKELFD